ncbi:aldo/keto reductase [Sphaerisporangium corydalis]|uniref:Aldo/keto reductase n=1 Tax=Sphaerisporangium corydalis TaxID=1441875 RepID=A0ABV9EUF0_9ACTN|nr:aldo/keto reductase [Sphaerisporangium corydalis]
MTFGRATGLRVSEYALGTGTFGSRWGYGSGPQESRKIFERFAEAGGTFVDTADSYQFGESEEILGELLHGERDRFTLATKFTNGVNREAGVNGTGNSRKTMTRAVEASLRRLNTDYIDLLWVHFPDAVTPIEEIVRGLDDLTRSGKILYGGLSNFPAWRVARGATLAELRGWSPVTAVQLEYSLVERTADREILPVAEALGLGAALWSPLGGGLLTGKYRTGTEGRLTDWNRRLVHTEDGERKTSTIDAVLAVAQETGATPAQVAMAWLRERADRATTAFVPVIGPRTLEQLDDYLGALDVRLDEEQYRRLSDAGAAPLGQPHDQIAAQRAIVLGGDTIHFRPPTIPVA